MITREQITDRYPDNDFCFADGLDQAIMGVDEQSGRVIYSIRRIMKILSQAMSREDAREHLEFNITGGYIGPLTPIFCDDEI